MKIVTPSGITIDPATPRIEDINLEDIAYGLAKEERFSGNTFVPYSVAQHSVHVTDLLSSPHFHSVLKPTSEGLIRAALLHDAAEAYLGDIVKPLKNLLPDYMELEGVWTEVIAKRFGLFEFQFDDHRLKQADDILFQCEAFTLTAAPEKYGVDRAETAKLLDAVSKNYEDIGCILVPYVWPRAIAAQRFLQTARILNLS